jgi:hypothetical protein
MVVLDTLTPAERLALVLHDVFDVSFGEIGAIIDRSPVAARQLASRAPAPGAGSGRSIRCRAIPEAGKRRRLPGRLPGRRFRLWVPKTYATRRYS